MTQNMVLSPSFMTKTKTSECGQDVFTGSLQDSDKDAFKVNVIELGRKRFHDWRLKLPPNLHHMDISFS